MNLMQAIKLNNHRRLVEQIRKTNRKIQASQDRIRELRASNYE